MNTNYKIMTPGPTEIDPSVLAAMAVNGTNPDLDSEFFEIYKATVDQYNRLIGSSSQSYILCGEGILGLEAACASVIEEGDKILCISNGIFGAGFKGFIEMYGGEATLYEGDYRKGLDPEALRAFLKENSDFKAATLVHCETPSGITNDIEKLCAILNDYGILSIVDSVSAIGGEPVDFDHWHIDFLLGGSQKCLSAPAGLTMVTISPKGKASMQNRKTPIRGFYANLLIWEGWYEKQWFPYTQPLQSILGFKKAVENCLASDFVGTHASFGNKVRLAFEKAGFELYPQDHYSNTVTTVLLPEGVDFKVLFNHLKEDSNVLIGGGFGHLDNKIFRIGHMGSNNKEENMLLTMKALDQAFDKLNVQLNMSLLDAYNG